MRQGPIEITLFNPATGVKYPERLVGGITYAVAVPGQEYHVQVTLHDSSKSFPRKGYLKLNLRIDGQGLGYVGLVGPLKEEFLTTPFVFNGFAHASMESESDFLPTSAFTFQTTKSRDENQRNINYDLGRIQLTVFHSNYLVKVPAENFEPRCSNKILDENKKWWKQPNVCTQAGRNNGRKQVAGHCVDEYNSRVLAKFELRYQPAIVLDLQEKDLKAKAEARNSNANSGSSSSSGGNGKLVHVVDHNDSDVVSVKKVTVTSNVDIIDLSK